MSVINLYKDNFCIEIAIQQSHSHYYMPENEFSLNPTVNVLNEVKIIDFIRISDNKTIYNFHYNPTNKLL